MSGTIAAVVFGTIMMLVLTFMVYDFVDLSSCKIDLSKDPCDNEISRTFFGVIIFGWIIYVGVGSCLGLMVYNQTQKDKIEKRSKV